MALRSRLLDAGAEDMWIWPEVKVVDARGNPVRVPADKPVKIRVTTTEDRSSDAELPGQISMKARKCITRDAPVGSWAKIVYDGEVWDVAAPPRFSVGRSKNTRHVEFSIRSRNQHEEPPRA